MRTLLTLIATVSMLAFAASATPSVAGPGKDRKSDEQRAKQQAREAAYAALRRGEILPLARIIEIANARVPGDIIEIEYKPGPKYKVKVLASTGRVQEVELDARTGEIIKIEDD